MWSITVHRTSQRREKFENLLQQIQNKSRRWQKCQRNNPHCTCTSLLFIYLFYLFFHLSNNHCTEYKQICFCESGTHKPSQLVDANTIDPSPIQSVIATPLTNLSLSLSLWILKHGRMGVWMTESVCVRLLCYACGCGLTPQQSI